MIIKHKTNKYFYIAIRKLFLKEFPPSFNKILHAFLILKIILKGEKRRLKTQNEKSTPIPYACIFSITWKCNLNCIGCYAKHYPYDNQLKTHEIKKIIEQSSSLGIYIFIIVGGEPLMNPEIIDILSKIKNSLFFLFTNGTLLDYEKVKKLKNSKNIIPIISTEGNDSFVDLRRGQGMGEKINNALNLLKSQNVIFGFSSMITHRNLKEVLSKDWFNSLWTYGARFGFIIDYIPFPKTIDKTLVLDIEDMKYKKSKIEELNYKSKITLFNFPENEYKHSGCKSAGNGFIHINANGNVEPCPFSHYASDNIRNSSLIDILNSNFFRKIRSEFQDKPNNHKSCLLFYNEDIVKKIANDTNAFCTEK